jgi:hypothetical protein
MGTSHTSIFVICNMIREIAICVLLLPSMWLAGQTNLVHNPSLEDTLCCPISFVDIHCAKHWYQPNPGGSSTDFFHPCDPQYNTWLQMWDMISPRTGIAFARIVTFYNSNNSTDHYREYLCGQLKSPLQSGVCYNVAFWWQVHGIHLLASLYMVLTASGFRFPAIQL